MIVQQDSMVTNFFIYKYFLEIVDKMKEERYKWEEGVDHSNSVPLICSDRSLFLSPTDKEEMMKLILSLPNKSSVADDSIKRIVLKRICEEIAEVNLVNLSL